MAELDTNMGGDWRDFPATSWSMIRSASDSEDPAYVASLELLIRSYWKPIYFYIRAAGRRGVEDAKDLTQDFFTRLLEKEQVQTIKPERGSFRGFLKRAIRNFMVDAIRSEAARRPKAGARLFRIDETFDEVQSVESDANPDALFDREWSRSVLHTSLQLLEVRMTRDGKEDWFALFQEYCLPDGTAASVKQTRRALSESDSSRETYDDLAKRRQLSETQVRWRLAYCRQQLREVVRERIREYVEQDQDVEAEYREILKG